ncbi:MAG: hypothetical protein QM831_34150 [Kofleriaceae bacterium]
MAISLNGVSSFSHGSYRTSSPVATDVATKRITSDAMVGAPPSVQQLGRNQEALEQPQPAIQLQGNFHVDHVTAIEQTHRMSQLNESQLPIHQASYARTAYEAASAIQTMSDAVKISG